ncbi:SSI family serine proteinase inhibitor [Streptomyces sp. NPDC058773]|uniref:SSI family serine proteinase inhibitor n=1 Tax=Streptomyces sp. NPDC058773 TaxID=3346632 RepID=UPI0036A2B568
MPYRRTSSLFTAAATAAATAVARLSTATAGVPRLSAAAAGSAAVSVASAAAVLVLAAPVVSAAPIPLPHVRSGDGVIGAGHHTPDAQPRADAQPLPDGRSGAARHHAAGARPGHASAARPGQVGPSAGRTLDNPLLVPAGPTPGSPLLDPAGRRPADAGGVGVPYPGVVDHLTVTVRGTGSAGRDGTFELYCHPARGNHPHARKACEKLDGMTRWGRDPFAPVPQGANCTMIYGGPATAHITGTWAGRPVNADFRRTNGCEISRWHSFEPLLPSTGS